MVAKEARQHHHIPEFYLRGFATGSGKRRRIQVGNIIARNFFEVNPKKIGKKRDFNRVEIPGHKPDALESNLSKFESEVAQSIRNVSASPKFEGDDRRNILNLIALLAVRSPQMREHIRQMSERMMKKMLGLSLASKERWEEQEAAMIAAGKGPAPGEPQITYEDMKEYYEKDEYEITLNREYHIGLELQLHDSVLRMLAIRKWQMYVIEKEDDGCFVTTDRPVVLTYNDPEKVPLLFRDSPGFGLPDTEVLFPLTKNLSLIGSFEGDDNVVTTRMPLVASANLRMIQWAYAQFYTEKRVIPYIGPDMRLYHDAHFFDKWRRYSKLPEGVQDEQPKFDGKL